MSQWSGQGMGNYEKRLNKARTDGVVGVHNHMRRPTAPAERLGYKGKKPNNKTMEELAEKMALLAKTRPELKQAAQNLASLVSANKPEKAQAQPLRKDEKQLQERIEQLKAAQPKTEAKPKEAPKSQPKAQVQTLPPRIEAPKVVEVNGKTFDPEALRKKAKAEQIKKLAEDMKVPQYDAKWVNKIKLSDMPG
jgi:seryl-tRNA synthetase